MSRYYLSFRIGNYWYGVPIEHVVEVLQMVSLTELPASAPEVLGTMTLRELIMPVIDLRILFKEKQSTITLSTPIIALTTGNGAMGLVVDDVDDVQSIPHDIPKESHESPFVKSIVRLSSGQTLMLVDVVSFNKREQPHTVLEP